MAIAGASRAQTGFAAVALGLGAAGASAMLELLLVQLPRLVVVRGTSVEAADREARQSARLALAVSMSAAIAAALLARPALGTLLGHAFAGASGAVELALPSVPLGVACGLGSLLASLRLGVRPLAAAWTLGAFAFIVVAAATIPSIQARGAATALSAALAVTAVAMTSLIESRDLRTISLLSFTGAAAVLGVGLAVG